MTDLERIKNLAQSPKLKGHLTLIEGEISNGTYVQIYCKDGFEELITQELELLVPHLDIVDGGDEIRVYLTYDE